MTLDAEEHIENIGWTEESDLVDATPNLATLQKELLHMRIQSVLSRIQTLNAMDLIGDEVVNEITDKIREDIHEQPDWFFDKILDKIDDHIYSFVWSKLLKLDAQQTKMYYEGFLADAQKIIKEVKDTTISDLTHLEAVIFGIPYTQTQTNNTPGDISSTTQPSDPQNPSESPHSNTVIAVQKVDQHPPHQPPLNSKWKMEVWKDEEPDIPKNSIETSAALFNPGLKNKVDKAQWWVKNGEIRYDHLHQNLRALYVDMNKKFPGLCITSCNDGSHAHNSRHYDDLALDIGKWSSDPQAYNKFVSYLKTHEQEVKEDYDVEDIIWLKGEKDHLHHIHIELPKSDKYSNHYTNQNVA